MNKKAITFTKFMLAGLFLLTFLTMGLLIIADMTATYDITDANETDIIDADVAKSLNETIVLFEAQKADIINQTIESGEDSWFSMLRGVYTAIKTPFTVAGNVFNAFALISNAVGRKLGIPPWIGQVAIVAIGIVFVGILIAKIFRFQES